MSYLAKLVLSDYGGRGAQDSQTKEVTKPESGRIEKDNLQSVFRQALVSFLPPSGLDPDGQRLSVSLSESAGRCGPL